VGTAEMQHLTFMGCVGNVLHRYGFIYIRATYFKSCPYIRNIKYITRMKKEVTLLQHPTFYNLSTKKGINVYDIKVK
jgi:hypothetical protein